MRVLFVKFDFSKNTSVIQPVDAISVLNVSSKETNFDVRKTLMIKYDVVFKKTGDMVYISHLDLMLMFRRAIRRSGVPFVLTKGFSPRVKISIPKALKLGRSSENEAMSLWLTHEAARNDVTKAINSELPEGVQIVS